MTALNHQDGTDLTPEQEGKSVESPSKPGVFERMKGFARSKLGAVVVGASALTASAANVENAHAGAKGIQVNESDMDDMDEEERALAETKLKWTEFVTKSKENWKSVAMDPNKGATLADIDHRSDGYKAEVFATNPKAQVLYPSDFDSTSDWPDEGMLTSNGKIRVSLFLPKMIDPKTKKAIKSNWQVIICDTHVQPTAAKRNPYGFRVSMEIDTATVEQAISFAKKTVSQFESNSTDVALSKE